MRILLRFSMGFVAAAIAALTILNGRIALAFFCVLLLLGLLLCVRRYSLWPAVLGFLLGIIWTYSYQCLAVDPICKLAGNTVDVTGVAIDYSTPTTYGVRVPAELILDDHRVKTMVWLYTDEEIGPGDTFSVTAELREADGEDSYYYRSENIYLRAYGKGTPEIQKTYNHPIRFYPRYAAHALKLSLLQCMPEDSFGYAAALATGDRTGLTLNQKSAMKAAGVYHMMALSGMHLIVLLGALTLLFRRKKPKAFLEIIICVLFALVTGASASIVRAAIMQSMILLAPLFGKEEDTPTSMGFAALVMTAQNPWCIFGLGFQLSFCSMAGILLFSDRIYRKLKGKRRLRGKTGHILVYILRSLAMSFSAMLFSFPLLMYSAGRASLISPLSCLLAGEAVIWSFRGSLLTALIGLVFKPAGTLVGWITAWLIRYVQLVSGLLSRIPFAAVSAGNKYFLVWIVVLYAILIVCLVSRERPVRPVIPACCAMLCFAVCLTCSVAEHQGTSMTVLNVGQGQCLLLRLDGRTIVVDCGGSGAESTGDKAADWLSDMGVDHIDSLILTHFDRDHVAGVPELFARIPILQLLVPDLEDTERDEICAVAALYNCDVYTVSSTTSLRADSGTITLFSPLDEEKNSGMCVLLDAKGFSTLVTGDINAQMERLLICTHDIPPIDILVAGHHGAATSTSQSLLNALRPKITVISVGENNYDHPAEETLERLHGAGTRVFRTDLCGTITLKGE